jgi:hypothetical protein
MLFGIPPGLFGIPPRLFGIPPGLFGIPPGLFGIPPEVFGIPPGLFGIPPGLFGLPPGAGGEGRRGDERGGVVKKSGLRVDGEAAVVYSVRVAGRSVWRRPTYRAITVMVTALFLPEE